ncbi:MAG: carbohydrate kinase family protein [Ideonella sp. MAG2]|nr:MAG: carbohydrate kinase family protein [Ideonella sp. MAG2]
MACLVSGSLAFDTITSFPGRFADQILPEQVHILNVSFLVPTLRREWGGCAGNIAYTLQALGGQAVVAAALGNDGADYLARMQGLGIDTAAVLQVAESYTAQAMIITDADNNQITAFHPGAMQYAHEIKLPNRPDIRLALIGPDGREAMLRRAQDLSAAGIPFVFDPGQGLPMFNGEELRQFIALATWVAVNDYEGKMLCERTGLSLETLSNSHLKGVLVTLAAQGCDIWEKGHRTHVPGVAAADVLDPTGCGDAFRGALLYGLEQGWPLARCVALGNQLGALKIACRGGQNHVVDRAALGL